MTVPFSLLYTENDNDSITPIVDNEPSGVVFEVSRAEYDAICVIQKVLREEEEKQPAIRRIRVTIEWRVHDYPNLMMKGYAFSPETSELEISVECVTLVMYHNGHAACVVKAEIAELLQQLFNPQISC